MTERLAPTPDFYDYPWRPLVSADLGGGDPFRDAREGGKPEANTVTVAWSDGQALRCYSLWLVENGWGYGVEPLSRESMIDPADLPPPDHLAAASIDGEGALELTWRDGSTTVVHPGWLRHVADGRQRPDSYLPQPIHWSAETMPEPPTVDGSGLPDDPAAFHEAVEYLCAYGLVRVVNTPTTEDFVGNFARMIGPIRGSNFGDVFTVASVSNPDSTANTSLALGLHADLPTRETPPGVQLLHCIDSTVVGGASRMTDGLALVDALEREHPADFEALCTLEWTFFNRSPNEDHRWTGPMIDRSSPDAPLTLRAFYPVRAFPAMPAEDVARSYVAMRLFSELARSDRFMLRFPFASGVMVAFDNRRVLHGRDGFDPSGGQRRLRGCYLDRDDLHSRMRVLARRDEMRAGTISEE